MGARGRGVVSRLLSHLQEHNMGMCDIVAHEPGKLVWLIVPFDNYTFTYSVYLQQTTAFSTRVWIGQDLETESLRQQFTHAWWQVQFARTSWRVNPLDVYKVILGLHIMFLRYKRKGGKAPASHMGHPWARFSKARPGLNGAFCPKICPQTTNFRTSCTVRHSTSRETRGIKQW